MTERVAEATHEAALPGQAALVRLWACCPMATCAKAGGGDEALRGRGWGALQHL